MKLCLSLCVAAFIFMQNAIIAQTVGDGVAAYSLGQYDKAIAIWESLADSDLDAQFRLGDFYERGIGVTRDYAGAAAWYRKAAMQGYAPAQFQLGLCYDHGKGVSSDVGEALRWYCLAAEQV